jgi:hypothetical protein
LPSHLLPVQQGWPGPPQVAQTEDEVEVPEQTRPLPVQVVVYELLEVAGVVVQQVAPAVVPHSAQMPDTHLVLEVVHSVPVETLVLVLVEQHDLPGPPQAPALQVPSVQVPGIGIQLLPLATQTLLTQQPLL